MNVDSKAEGGMVFEGYKDVICVMYRNAEKIGSSKLHIACATGLYANVTDLVRADLTCRCLHKADPYGDTPISLLWQTNDIRLMCAMCSGLPIWPAQLSPYHWLVQKTVAKDSILSDEKAANWAVMLTRSGARSMINARNYNGFTPLMRAVRANYRKLTLSLIECGADCNALTPRFVHLSHATSSWLRGGGCCKPRDFKPPIFLCLVRLDFELARAMVERSTRVLDHTWIGKDQEGSDWEREVFEYAFQTAKCLPQLLSHVIDLMTGKQILRAFKAWVATTRDDIATKRELFVSYMTAHPHTFRDPELASLKLSCDALAQEEYYFRHQALLMSEDNQYLYNIEYPTDESGVDFDPESNLGF